MHRRDFLKTMATTGIGAFASLQFAGKASAEMTEERKMIPKRPFGKTGKELSIIGFGGVIVIKMQQSEANSLVREAIDRGVNYFDVAPTYGNGKAEKLLGPALEGYRDKIFLACKTTKRKKEEAAAELHQSLERLKTDHFDLYQFHAISKMEDVETIFGPDGAVEAFLEAKKQGLIKYIGFSAHSVKAALAASLRPILVRLSTFIECIAAVWWLSPSAWYASSMAESTSFAEVTGSTGMSCSVHINGWSLGTSDHSTLIPSGRFNPIAPAMNEAFLPTYSLFNFGSLHPFPPSMMTFLASSSICLEESS